MNVSFLDKNSPINNLKTLSSFGYEDTSKTKTITQEVYRKVPKESLAPSTLREICLTSSLIAIFSGPFFFTAKKVVDCVGKAFSDGGLETLYKCPQEIDKVFNQPNQILTYLVFSSFVLLNATAAYAGARYFFQDRTQEERFKLLETEYVAMRKQLEKKPDTDTAEKLINNQQLIRINLVEKAKLSENQANKLVIPIIQTAKKTMKDPQKFTNRRFLKTALGA